MERSSEVVDTGTVNSKVFGSIPPLEAFRAIYIDFEKFKLEAPALIGIACEYEFRQIVLADEYKRVANASGLQCASIAEVASQLLDRCTREDRRLVAYSQHDRDVLVEYAGVDPGDNYRNARKISSRWINRMHPDGVPENGLSDLLRFIGYTAPPHLAKGTATKRLKDVRDGLRAHRKYSRLTKLQKEKWSALLEYNRVDCLGMRDLVLRAASELGVVLARSK